MFRTPHQYAAAVAQLRDADEARARLEADVERFERAHNGELEPLRNFAGFGELLTALRVARGITQAELARRLGSERGNVSRDERTGYRGLTVERAGRILDALGVCFEGRFVGVDAAAPGPWNHRRGQDELVTRLRGLDREIDRKLERVDDHLTELVLIDRLRSAGRLDRLPRIEFRTWVPGEDLSLQILNAAVAGRGAGAELVVFDPGESREADLAVEMLRLPARIAPEVAMLIAVRDGVDVELQPATSPQAAWFGPGPAASRAC